MPAEHPAPAARPPLPRGAIAGGAVGGVLLLALLGTVAALLVSLERSRSAIESTRAHLVEIDRRTDRGAEDLAPVIDATRPLTSAPGRRELATTFDAVGAAADRVPGLADDARGIVAITAHVDEVLTRVDEALTRAGLATAVPEIRRAIASGLDLLASQRRLTDRSLRVQLRTLGVSRETERLLRASLGVQREVLGHARSLDEKVPDLSGLSGLSR